MKKASNGEIPKYDDLKLKEFTRGKYGYKLGASIVADDLVAPELRKLREPKWY